MSTVPRSREIDGKGRSVRELLAGRDVRARLRARMLAISASCSAGVMLSGSLVDTTLGLQCFGGVWPRHWLPMRHKHQMCAAGTIARSSNAVGRASNRRSGDGARWGRDRTSSPGPRPRRDSPILRANPASDLPSDHVFRLSLSTEARPSRVRRRTQTPRNADQNATTPPWSLDGVHREPRGRSRLQPTAK